MLASGVMLFAELALIRWVSAYQVHVAYFTNFVLLASFLGIGVGFLRSGRERNGFRWAPASFAIFTALVFVVRVVKDFGDAPGLESSFGLPAPPIWVALPVLFLGAVWVMANVAEGVARLFDRFEPLEAYRLDITGSLLGIVVFSALSFLGLGPIVWGVLLAIAFLGLTPAGGFVGRWAAVAGVAVVLTLGSLAPHDVWSPYYRVTVYGADAGGRIPVRVNSLPHQAMLPLDEIRTAFYAEPYTHLDRPPGDVLIVGAGNGNDVALALAEGADRIDAVEIDPRLQRAGSELHPAGPYQDPRVTPHIDDGRAFLERTGGTYDLILFALPDSLTLVSGQGSLRLESYLFTREAMEAVRDRLAPGGVYAMYNYYRPDVFERYANTMREVFGHEPCFDAGRPGAGARAQSVLTIGREAGDITCATLWSPGKDAPAPATDDHPFPYVMGRWIPSFYFWWLVGILVASFVVVRRASGGPVGRMRPYADLFCMGAAFLLLETKSVVQFALLFGTTWFVNSLVFAGILLAVLAAVELARRAHLPSPGVMYVALLACLAVAWVVPPSSLLSLSLVPRFLAGVSVAFAPVFVANLIFAQRFRDVGASTIAFGANLLGAMLGGVLEYLAIVTGYRNLLFAVALLYGLAFLLGRRHLNGAAAARADAPPAAAPEPGAAAVRG
ncbi:MAG: spermidine synthase [Actinomycetota bacterium]